MNSWGVDDEIEDDLLFNDMEDDYDEENEDYEIDDGDRGFLNSYSSTPVMRILNAIGLPILAAIAATLLISIPKLESIPLIGYFKKTIAFISVVTYLVVLILMIIMFNVENGYFKLSNNTQVLIVLAIVAAAFIFNFLFDLDKQPKSKDEIVLSVINTYSNGMADYTGKKMGYDKTEKHFADLLNKITARINKIPDGVLDRDQKDSVTSGAYNNDNGISDNSFIKVHKVLYAFYKKDDDFRKLEPKKDQLDFTPDQEEKFTKEFEPAFDTFKSGVWSQNNINTLIPNKQLEHDAINEIFTYIDNIQTYINSVNGGVARKIPLYEEAHRKLVLLICTNKVVNWEQLIADQGDNKFGVEATYDETTKQLVTTTLAELEKEDTTDNIPDEISGLYKARILLGCDSKYKKYKANKIKAMRTETFTQPVNSSLKSILKEKESIQDMIDQGKIQ